LYMWNHNPNLNPERIMSYETGLLRSFLDGKVNAEITGYITDGDNLIVTGAMGNLYNSGIIRNKGIELAVNANPFKDLSFNLSYSYIHMKSPLFATPKHNLFVGARYNWKKFNLSANIHQIIDLDTDVTPVTKLESYTLINTKIVYHLSSKLEIFANAENLLNQEYEINRYYSMPGTTLFGGVNFRIGK